MPGFPVLNYLPEFAQTHVHWVDDAIQQFHQNSTFKKHILFFEWQIRVFSKESALWIRWPKYWSFSFSISPSSEYSGLISFRIDWFDLLAVQGTLKSSLAPQYESISSLVLSLLYGPTLTSRQDYWKMHTLPIRTYVGKVMCLLFTMLCRLVIAFFLRSKCLLISSLQSPSTVILEPKK